MPELPEVEAVCRRLRKHAVGATIVSAHIVRRRITAPQDPADVEALAAGRSIDRIDRRGKNILIGLSGGFTMRVHLRMTGNLYAITDWRLRVASTSAWFELPDGRALLFEDPRGLGTLTIHDGPMLSDLGPEPPVAPIHGRLPGSVGAGIAAARQAVSDGPAAHCQPGEHLCRRGLVRRRHRSAA